MTVFLKMWSFPCRVVSGGSLVTIPGRCWPAVWRLSISYAPKIPSTMSHTSLSTRYIVYVYMHLINPLDDEECSVAHNNYCVVEYFTESDELFIKDNYEMILIYVVPYSKKFSRGPIFAGNYLRKLDPLKISYMYFTKS